MTERTLPNIALKGGYDLGEDGWGPAMNENLLRISVLVQGVFIDKVSALPGSPAIGDIYILDETAPSNANTVAVYDGPVGAGAWSYFTPREGWLLYNQTQEYYERFNGSVWAELVTGGTGGGGGSGGSAWSLQWSPLDNEPPVTNFATLDTRNNRAVLDFDDTTQEAAIFTGVLPSDYAGSGVTVSLWCALTSAVSGTVGWDVAFERTQVSTDDIDSDSFATAQVVAAVTVPGTSGQVLRRDVAISNGASMDSLAAGELFRLRVRRNVADDTATGDAELLRVMLRET